MASYKVLSDNSTLGPRGSSVTDDDLERQSLNAALLVRSGIIEPASPAKTPKTEKED